VFDCFISLRSINLTLSNLFVSHRTKAKEDIMPRDKRRTIGARVIAKAIHVTNLAECKRRYGSNAKTKEIWGTVVEVRTAPTTTNRITTSVVVDFEFDGGDVKRAELNIRSVKAAPTVPTERPTGEPPPAMEDVTSPTLAAPPVDPALPVPARTETTTAAPPTTAAAPGADPIGGEAAAPVADADEAPVVSVPGASGGAATVGATANVVGATATVGATAEDEPTTVAHDLKWYEDDAKCRTDINGAVPIREWGVRTPVGDVIGERSDCAFKISRMDYFLLMFPPSQLTLMHRLMNEEICRIGGHKDVTKGELLKFIGILILISKFEFGKRAALWSNTAQFKYVPTPGLGKTGMPRQRFDILFRCLKFGEQPMLRAEGMSSERYRWLLVDDFVTNINAHRASNFIPSHHICVDESMARWYGLGGHWINMGLPQYIAIDRKPENGCEIQNSACGICGVMMCLKLVKTAAHDEEEAALQEDESGMLHGTKVLKSLVDKWAYTDRIVCADSYFASVSCADEMRRIGLKFIGVVKTATKKFPKPWLSAYEMVNRGERKGLIVKDDSGRAILMAYVWMDRDRRYFITNTSSLSEGRPYIRQRWRQVDQEPNAEPELVDLVVSQPKACEVYYSTCGLIDQHNRHRQDTLCLEKKIETKNWATRVGSSLLAMMIVDSWLVYSQATKTQESQQDYYAHLAEELIDNTYDQVGSGTRRSENIAETPSPDLVHRRTGAGRAGVYAHLTPTKRRKKLADGSLTTHSQQGRCRQCGLKTRYVCSTCNDEMEDYHDDGQSSVQWLCHTETHRMCFPEHVSIKHT
jgi:hypothetical protein